MTDTEASRDGRTVVLLLGAGERTRELASAFARLGADVVTAPLAPDPRLAQIALDRYDEVAAAASATWSSTVTAGA